MTILLVNPNGSARVTTEMLRAAREILDDVEGMTMEGMPPMLTTPEALARSALRVAAITPGPHITGLIVAAFGDPGRAALARRLDLPVTGIGVAAAGEARALAKPFAVATTTPGFRDDIDRLMGEGGDGYRGSYFTAGDPVALLADRDALDAALLDAVTRAAEAGARSVIIGGGPLGDAVDRLQPHCDVALIHPVRAAARRMLDLTARPAARRLADRLVEAERTGTRFDPGEDLPEDHADAYAVQRHIAAALGPAGAFKTGRQDTAPRIVAPIRADRCLPSGARVPVKDRMGIELEVGFRVTRPGILIAPPDDLPAYLAPVAALELVDTRIDGASAGGVLVKLADAQMNWGLVTGDARPGRCSADLTRVRARLTCGGETVLDGEAPVQGGSALAAIREALPLIRRHHGALLPGQVLITGALHPLVWFPSGTEIRGEIEGIGHVAATLV